MPPKSKRREDCFHRPGPLVPDYVSIRWCGKKGAYNIQESSCIRLESEDEVVEIGQTYNAELQPYGKTQGIYRGTIIALAGVSFNVCHCLLFTFVNVAQWGIIVTLVSVLESKGRSNHSYAKCVGMAAHVHKNSVPHVRPEKHYQVKWNMARSVASWLQCNNRFESSMQGW